MQTIHAFDKLIQLEKAGARQTPASPLDRYRPAALLALCKLRPFELRLEESPLFRWMMLQALPDFTGDETDVAAMLDEDTLRSADAAIALVVAGVKPRLFAATCFRL